MDWELGLRCLSLDRGGALPAFFSTVSFSEGSISFRISRGQPHTQIHLLPYDDRQPALEKSRAVMAFLFLYSQFF